ncbi:hypothetical protein PCASD_18429 [Puccinia coronata f. sp. avenae]|uniref:DUF6589 domain-containing protein n=1 Tax=Puccinia coronata f. sp. avenae TaxID=200324 RepID=A0A2N5TZ37_9BASI|nr:hypothetical protein PCASD_18429 [Puccinia coronata f. sp. avenae]
MLKMMIVSDNSAKGMGKVLQGINNQTNESPAEFSERLQVMEGDLGTYCNLESIRALRKPTAYAEESLSNKFMLLGASHTLWNVAQAVFLLHHGDSLNSEDLGAWHTMESLGIPLERPITKKDFTLMISNMQRVHEVTIVYCLLKLVGKTNVPKVDNVDQLPTWSVEKVQDAIDKCYNQLFSPKALQDAAKDAFDKESPKPKQHNLMM